MTACRYLFVMVASLGTCAAFGDPGGPPADADRVAPDLTLPTVGEADAPSAAEDDLARLLESLSPEEVQQLIRTAVQSRLQVERQQAAAEMKEDLLADPKDVKEALRVLEDGPKNTQKDNIDRILLAWAKVDPRFGKAWKLMEDRKHAEAAALLEKELNVQEATYRNAARYTLCARALAAQGKGYEAAEMYQKILVVMADRISFAAGAALESARIYEDLQRFTYAMQMYSYAVTNYGLTLDDEALALIDRKAEEYARFSEDPLGWAEKTMAQVRNRLESSDSGKETQQKEDQIVAVITDLIKTAEEQQQSGQSQGQGQGQQRGQRQGEGQGEGQGQGSAQGGPKGTQQPSNPAQVSALVPGAVARPTSRSEVHDTSESGDWATLPPRERQKLEQLRKKVMSERYRDIISKYRTKIAERGTQE